MREVPKILEDLDDEARGWVANLLVEWKKTKSHRKKSEIMNTLREILFPEIIGGLIREWPPRRDVE